MNVRIYWDRYRERRSRKRAEWQIAMRNAAQKQREADLLEADRKAKLRERNMQLLEQYGPIVSTSVGAGIFAAVIAAIASHSTRATVYYANILDQEGYPPVWFWAGLAGAIAVAGIMFRRSR